MTSKWLMAKFTTAAPAWTAKLARPSDRMVPSVRRCGRMYRRCSLSGTFFVKTKYHTTATQDTAWPQTVARALPSTPQPSFRTNR